MQYLLSKEFEKGFAKLPKSTKQKVISTLTKFVANPNDPSLRNHSLQGRYSGHFSLNVTGDVRAIYVYVEAEIVYFVAIGTHSQLYG